MICFITERKSKRITTRKRTKIERKVSHRSWRLHVFWCELPNPSKHHLLIIEKWLKSKVNGLKMGHSPLKQHLHRISMIDNLTCDCGTDPWDTRAYHIDIPLPKQCCFERHTKVMNSTIFCCISNPNPR